MNQIENVDLQALGLTYEQYLQIINCPDIEEKQPVSPDVVKKEEAEKEAKELEASRLLVKEMLEAQGEDPERIEEILKSLDPDFNPDNKEPAPAPAMEEEEEKLDGEELELIYQMQEERNKLPPTMKELFDALSLADKKKFLEDMKREKEDLELINQVLAQDMQDEERLQIKEDKESEEYIKKLVEEEEKAKEEEDEAMQGDCPICLDGLFSQAIFPLNNCGHLFHIGCLETYVIEEIKKRTFPIKCPNPDCKIEIPEDDIKDTLQAHIEYQDIYDEYYIKSYVDSHPTEFYQCPTANCKFICSVEGARFDCPECQKTYCVECKTEWHHKMSCKQFQEQKKNQGDDVFEKYAKNMKYMRCPKCKVFVERIEGCNAMVCTRCQAQFCYQCGREGDGHLCNHMGAGGFRPNPRPYPIIRPNPRPIRRPMPHPVQQWRRPGRAYPCKKEVVNPKVVNMNANFSMNLK